MANVKIVKATDANAVTIGSSDYPLDAFRAQYKGTYVNLIPVHTNLIRATRLKFMYADLIKGDNSPVGTTDSAVRTYLQAQLYSAPVETPPAG